MTVGGMGFIPERLLMMIDDDDDLYLYGRLAGIWPGSQVSSSRFHGPGYTGRSLVRSLLLLLLLPYTVMMMRMIPVYYYITILLTILPIKAIPYPHGK